METKHTPGPWEITHAIIGTVDPVKHPSAVVAAPSGSVDTICDFNWMTKRPIQEQVANARLIAAAPELLAALKGLLMRDERNTCTHEQTHRGGAIWEICDSCGAKWADDEGGRPEWRDPPEWETARAAIARAEGR